MSDIQYRRNLPHIHLDGYPLFITFRLAGSLPAEVAINLREQREQELRVDKKSMLERHEIENRYFTRYDQWLDSCSTVRVGWRMKVFHRS